MGDEDVVGVVVHLLRRSHLVEHTRFITAMRSPWSWPRPGRASRRSWWCRAGGPPTRFRRASARVWRRGCWRFVHQEDRGFAHDRPPHGDALALTAGQLRRLAVEVLPSSSMSEAFWIRALISSFGILRNRSVGDVVPPLTCAGRARMGLEDHRDVTVLRWQVVDGRSPMYSHRRRCPPARDHASAVDFHADSPTSTGTHRRRCRD